MNNLISYLTFTTNYVMYLFIALSLFNFVYSKKITEANEENCEVCVKFLKKFERTLDEETRKDQTKIQNTLRKYCKNTVKDDNRFCYYIGALEESATGRLGDISRPMKIFKPSDKICFDLYLKDQQICDLRYEKTYDFATVNFKKLKVGELKQILADWGETCKGCTEKADYIRLIEDVLPKYAPDASIKRGKPEL